MVTTMKSSKIFPCGFCERMCDNSIMCERKKVYMGSSTDIISKVYYCDKNCFHSHHREDLTPIFEKNIATAMRNIHSFYPDYLKAISVPDTSKKLLDLVVPLFDYLNTKIAFMNSLLERKPRQESIVKWVNFKKCLREMIELSYDDDEKLNKYYNELFIFGNEVNINAFAS